MRTLERAGYVLVAGVFAAFILAFNYSVEDLVTADKVQIVPFSVPLNMTEPSRVTEYLAEDNAMVTKGQAVLRIVQGSAVDRYAAWEAVEALRRLSGDTEEVRRLSIAFPKPATTLVVAPAAGVFRKVADSAAAGEDIARIVDYSDLRLAASLAGQTVSQAAVGQPTRITSISTEPDAGVLFRGTDSISGSILGKDLRDAVSNGLVGRGIQVRDDTPLAVTEVTEVQVDATTRFGSATPSGESVALDPVGSLVLDAEVISGTPAATIQVADLPANVYETARKLAQDRTLNRAVKKIDGSTAQIAGVENLRFLVKLKAGPASQGMTSDLAGAMVSRSFEAGVQLKQPPNFLIEAVRRADQTGRKVTARVEMVTGKRPIAMRLLKKS
jgi:hypothetical protein